CACLLGESLEFIEEIEMQVIQVVQRPLRPGLFEISDTALHIILTVVTQRRAAKGECGQTCLDLIYLRKKWPNFIGVPAEWVTCLHLHENRKSAPRVVVLQI